MNEPHDKPLKVSVCLAETIMTGSPDQLQAAVADCIDAEIRPLVETLEKLDRLIIAGDEKKGTGPNMFFFHPYGQHEAATLVKHVLKRAKLDAS